MFSCFTLISPSEIKPIESEPIKMAAKEVSFVTQNAKMKSATNHGEVPRVACDESQIIKQAKPGEVYANAYDLNFVMEELNGLVSGKLSNIDSSVLGAQVGQHPKALEYLLDRYQENINHSLAEKLMDVIAEVPNKILSEKAEEMMLSGDDSKRRLALKLLLWSESPTPETINKLLESSYFETDVESKIIIVESLSKGLRTSHANALNQNLSSRLVELTNDSDENVRLKAISALTYTGNDQSYNTVEQFMASNDKSEQLAALDAAYNMEKISPAIMVKLTHMVNNINAPLKVRLEAMLVLLKNS